MDIKKLRVISGTATDMCLFPPAKADPHATYYSCGKCDQILVEGSESSVKGRRFLCLCNAVNEL
jgi:hypothetical protein